MRVWVSEKSKNIIYNELQDLIVHFDSYLNTVRWEGEGVVKYY